MKRKFLKLNVFATAMNFFAAGSLFECLLYYVAKTVIFPVYVAVFIAVLMAINIVSGIYCAKQVYKEAIIDAIHVAIDYIKCSSDEIENNKENEIQ